MSAGIVSLMDDTHGVAASLFVNEYRDRKLANKPLNFRAPKGVGSVSDAQLLVSSEIIVSFSSAIPPREKAPMAFSRETWCASAVPVVLEHRGVSS